MFEFAEFMIGLTRSHQSIVSSIETIVRRNRISFGARHDLENLTSGPRSSEELRSERRSLRFGRRLELSFLAQLWSCAICVAQLCAIPGATAPLDLRNPAQPVHDESAKY